MFGQAARRRRGCGRGIRTSRNCRDRRWRCRALDRQRRDVGADPVGDRRRHGAAQDRRGLHRDLPLVRQHHRLQPHQILAAAAAGAMDVGNAGGDRDRLGQRQPAGRGLALAGRGRWAPVRPACRAARLPAGSAASAAGWSPSARLDRPGPRPGAASATARMSARAARRGFGPARPEQARSRALARRPCAAAAARRSAQSISSHARSGNHGHSPQARAATRPFAACVPRAKVHVNSAEVHSAPSDNTIGRNVRMLGLMQDWPLLCHRIIEHAASGPRHAGSRDAVGRRSHPSHQLRRNSRSRPESLATPRSRRHQARRPRRHHRLEHLAPSRSLVRHHGHRRDLPYRQSAAVPRSDRLDHQPCAKTAW